MQPVSPDERHWRHAPRWEALIAALAIAAAYALLRDDFRLGPPWLMFPLLLLFLVPLNVARYLGNYRLVRALGFALSAFVTAALIASVVLLVARLPGGKTTSSLLLRDGGLLWGANILVFALWYWEIDCGGPHARHVRRYTSTDFLFPQFTTPDAAESNWSPRFLDYLFLSFNTSAAFSPTDTLVLSRPPKVLMMVQSLISIVVVAVLVSRAINTLGS
ncbi:MAG: hypothetical protein M3008_09565 [Chloroflexota bacterium]|nr:hypothetical protein [Chloroflexota bacterium]